MAVNMKDYFPPLAVFTYVATTDDATNDYVKFNYNGYVKGANVQVFAAADGAANVTGLKVAITPTKKLSEIKVTLTSITVGDVINVIFW